MSALKQKYLTLIICIMPLFFSCEKKDDNFNGLIPEETNKMYTNKVSSISAGNQLDLTYSNSVLLGKNVYFEIKNKDLAHITLLQIIPGEEKTFFEITSLSEIKEGGYTFTGKNITTSGISFTYSGSIKPNRLSLDLSDIKLPTNSLTSESPWYNIQTTLDWQLINGNLTWSILTSLLSNLLNNVLLSVLNDVTFSPDGNVFAQYASLPEETEISEMLTGSNHYNDRNADDWKTSPINVATYYLKEDKLFVIPQVEMLMEHLLPTNKTRVEIVDILDIVLSLLDTTSTWINEGIEFTVTEINPGQVAITLSRSQIDFLLPFIPYISSIIPTNVLPESIDGLLEELLLDASLNTVEFKLTLIFSKEK